MSVALSNNAVSKLSSSLTTGATTLSVTAGDGSKYPSPGAGEWFPVTIIKGTGALEIVRCTSRSGDVLTITRAQEGTSAQAFSVGDRVELRLTAAVVAELVAGLANAYKPANSLGTVSQSSGVPTGALMEYGSNVNGEYWKYANGQMICRATRTVITTVSSPIGALYYTGSASAAQPMPSNFIAPPHASLVISDEYPAIVECATKATTSTFGVYLHLSPLNLPLATYTYDFIAIGRWF